jgi:hypothetical protein
MLSQMALRYVTSMSGSHEPPWRFPTRGDHASSLLDCGGETLWERIRCIALLRPDPVANRHLVDPVLAAPVEVVSVEGSRLLTGPITAMPSNAAGTTQR